MWTSENRPLYNRGKLPDATGNGWPRHDDLPRAVKPPGGDNGQQRRCFAGITSHDQIGHKTPRGGSCLDAVTTLPDAPEKSFDPGIPAERQAAVRGEGAQPGPTMLDPPHRYIQRPLHTVDANGDIELLGLHVMRICRRRVGG